MADDIELSEQAVEARLGVALDALGYGRGATPLADSALRGARQVLLAFKMALLAKEPTGEPEPQRERRPPAA